MATTSPFSGTAPIAEGGRGPCFKTVCTLVSLIKIGLPSEGDGAQAGQPHSMKLRWDGWFATRLPLADLGKSERRTAPSVADVHGISDRLCLGGCSRLVCAQARNRRDRSRHS